MGVCSNMAVSSSSSRFCDLCGEDNDSAGTCYIEPHPFMEPHPQYAAVVEMAVPYHYQDYKLIKQELQTNGELFTDNIFLPNNTSLGKLHHPLENIIWKRPKEINSDPHLIVDGLAPSDLNQGQLGNCWFVAACSALALERKLWDKVVPDVQEQEWYSAHPDHYCGIFHFHFWRFGEWVDVVIDDWLPTKDGHLVFMKSKSGNEFWSALLEKAYAKLHGSYEALSGGHTSDALVDFTGGVSEVIGIDELKTDYERKKLFNNLISANQQQVMISCSINVPKGSIPNTVLGCGLINGHAYTIIDTREMKLSITLKSLFGNKDKLMMIKMRNPWGRKEWNGAWSDSSDEWSRVRRKEKEDIELTVEDDGEFWMEFHDWYQWFTHVTICYIINNNNWYYQYDFHGKWEGQLMGGANTDTIMYNPQYAFTITQQQEIMISLNQKNITDENYTIGFIIVKVEGNRQFRTNITQQWTGKVKFLNVRNIHGKFILNNGRYVIIPATYQAGLEREFIIRIYTKYKTHPIELQNVSSLECHLCGANTVIPKVGVVIRIHIIRAHGLVTESNETDINSFCKVYCNKQIAITPVHYNTSDPYYNTYTIFYITAIHQCNIMIEVLNRDTLIDQLLGEIQLLQLPQQPITEYNLNLINHHSTVTVNDMKLQFTVSVYTDLNNV